MTVGTAAWPEYAVHFTDNGSGVRGVVDDAPGPDKVEGAIGEAHGLRVHLKRPARQVPERKPPGRALDRIFRQVDARVRLRGGGKKLCMAAVSTADLEDVLRLQRRIIDEAIERGPLRRQEVGSRIKKTAINFIVEGGAEFGGMVSER